MYINPINIVNLLLVLFKALNFPNIPLTEKEREIAKETERIITQACNDISSEFLTQGTLEFDDPSEEHEAEIIEDEENMEIDLNGNDSSEENRCITEYEPINFEYKRRAVEYWKSGRTVQKSFKKVRSRKQLKRWEDAINQGGTRSEKLQKISESTLNRSMEALEKRLPIHDIDIR
ncbi:hypothetical protein ABEB36_009338 [Hypothenemus hampei]|uniref:Uncharacterized protein n=1 Tax=Hypothenemus hampei TaxID=57062 RepID=A0ABD1EGE5_HYPHA